MDSTVFWVNDQKQIGKHKSWPMQLICLNTTGSQLVIGQHKAAQGTGGTIREKQNYVQLPATFVSFSVA